MMKNVDRPFGGTEAKEIFSWGYSPSKVKRGYAGGFLKVDLSAGKISSGEITENDKEIFVGGRGLGLDHSFRRSHLRHHTISRNGKISGSVAFTDDRSSH